MNILISLLLAAAIALTPFPFKTEQELFDANDGIRPAACPGLPPIGVIIDSQDLTPGYWWRVGIMGDRFYALEVRGEDVVQVVHGRIIDGKLVVAAAYTLAEIKVKYPEGPCAWLTGKDA